MKKVSLILGILLLVWGITACVESISGNTPAQSVPEAYSQPLASPVRESTPTQTPTPASVVVTQTAIAVPTATVLPTQSVVIPRNAWVCPEPLEIPLEDFELDDHFLLGRLVNPVDDLPDSDVSGATLIDLQQSTLRTIPGSQPKEGWKLLDYKINPNDEQSIELVYKEVNGTGWEIWTSHWDGSQRTLVASFNLPQLPPDEGRLQGYYYERISDVWFAAMKYNLETNTDYPIFLYNRATGEERNMPPFPDGTDVYDFYSLNGVNYMLTLSSEQEQWLDVKQSELYNLETHTAIPAFQWLLSENAWSYTGSRLVSLIDGLFYIQVPAPPYGMDLAMGLDLETVLSDRTYEQVMHPIHLHGATAINRIGSPEEYWIMNGTFIPDAPFYLFSYPERFEQGASLVHLLDLSGNTVTNYCYPDREDLQYWLSSDHSISPDQRFVAFVAYTFQGEDLSHRVEILDLQTGEFAVIPIRNFEIIGWGRK